MEKRRMSPKGFLNKCNSKAAASAAGFLKAYREYLLTGEVSESTAPIVRKMDAGELLPTPALSEIRQAVMNHIMAETIARAEKQIENAGKQAVSKGFEATVYVAGEVYVDEKGVEWRKSFNKPQEAQRWADRRLFELPNSVAEVLHNGNHWEDIPREDAIARMLKRPGVPVMKRKPRSGPLSWGMKIREGKTSFSRG